MAESARRAPKSRGLGGLRVQALTGFEGPHKVIHGGSRTDHPQLEGRTRESAAAPISFHTEQVMP